MSKYKELPIYKASYDLMMRLIHVVRHFEREYKYTLGEKIHNESMELILQIYKANVKDKERRIAGIEKLLEHVQRLSLMLRMGHDLKLIPMEHYAQVVEMLDNISRQSTGWLNSTSGKSVGNLPAETAPESVMAMA